MKKVTIAQKEIQRFFYFVITGERNRPYEMFVTSLIEYPNNDLPDYASTIIDVVLSGYVTTIDNGHIYCKWALEEFGKNPICDGLNLSLMAEQQLGIPFNSDTVKNWIERELTNFIKNSTNLKMN